MWNYSFMFPSILILFTLLVFYFTRPRLSIRMNRTYVAMLVLEILIIASDLLSSLADENYKQFAPWVLYLLNTVFFVLYFIRGYGYFRFTADVLRIKDRRLLILTSIPFIVSEAAALSSFATGAVFTFRGGVYARGPLYDLLFYCYLFYALAGLALIFWKRKNLPPSDLAGCLGYTLALLIGTVVRKLYPQLLVMNTFSLIGLLIIYLAFQNPDLFLSERGHAFNMRGFTMTMEENIHRRDYFILGFVIRNYNNERSIFGGQQTDHVIFEVSQFLRQSFPACMPFYIRGGRFILFGSDRLQWDSYRDRIAERFNKPWNSGLVYLQVGFAEIKAQPRLKSVDRVVSNLNIALELVGKSDSRAPRNLKMDAKSIQQLDEEVDILRTLEEAIKRRDVEVFLQPVMDSRSRKLVAAEALSRIRNKNGTVVPPLLFIPVAERNGLIDELGNIVFQKTCEFIHDHDIKAMGLQWINVNLSPVQCLQHDLKDRLSDTLRTYNISPELIHLEITEMSIIDYSMMKGRIDELRGAGFQFVLDDYGSGYSNLIRVKHYPFIDIKLDMEVVWDYFKNRDSLLPHVVTAFRELGFTITAEGIETEEMADVLTAICCDRLQGFLFDKPLPLSEFIEKYS